MRLSLDNRCIETAARRARERIVARLLEGRGSREEEALAGDLEILTALLEGTDFRALRASRPELDGRAAIEVDLELDADGGVSCVAVDAALRPGDDPGRGRS